MKTFKDFLNKPCDRVHSIEDINDQFDYEDPEGGGDPLEWDLISCGQDGSTNEYNELEQFYKTHLEDNEQGLAWQQACIKVMCECCHDIAHPIRTHDAFKACVGQKLGIKID